MTSSKRMLLLTADGPYRPSPPTLVQSAQRGTAGDLVFGAATTPGNLLIALGGRRQATVFVPTDGGTWAELAAASWTHPGNIELNTCKAWVRLATAATTTYSWAGGGSQPLINLEMYEVSGSSLLGATGYSLSPGDGSPSSVNDIVDLGVVAPYQLAFAMWGNGADLEIQTVTRAAGWNRTYYAGRDFETGVSDTSGSSGFPYIYGAWAQGSGVDLHARIDLNASKRWGGVVVLLA